MGISKDGIPHSKCYEFSFDRISNNLKKDNVITFFNKNKNTYSSYLASNENIIEEEDKNKPLPDDQLAEILKEKGYPIARRTIAKYREQLDIPVARMRKKM